MIRNVLEHVAAANPEPPSGEFTEHDQAERDAIRAMVLASELPVPTVARPRRRRRAALALAAVAACAAIVVGVTASGRDATFADQAYAAVTASGLFHVVEETSIDAPPVVFNNEPFEEWLPTRTEAWYDGSDHASHFVVFEQRGGQLVPAYETAWKDGKSFIRYGDGRISEVPQADDDSTAHDESKDPTRPTEYYAVSLFQDAYRKDKVRDDGEVTIDGRRLRRLVLDVPPAQGAPGPQIGAAEQVMLFDPETLYPVQLTLTFPITIDGVEHPVKTTTHYRTFERIPETTENRAKLDLR
jgi:hypothetical protein